MKHLYEFGVIGNCSYLGYVEKDTNINWLCWPDFDSSFVFGKLLDSEKGGEFSIKPIGGIVSSNQYYEENTNILVTEIESEEGSYKVTDFAPRFLQNDRHYKPKMLIRIVEPISGKPRVKITCNPKGEYGEITPEVLEGSSHLRYEGLESSIRLSTNVSLNYVTREQFFVLNEKKYLILTYGVPLEGPLGKTSEDFYTQTKKYWLNWVKSTSIPAFYQELIIRSALTLKINQFEDTGAFIAAGTTSLPEHDMSTRNWDYRFCWLRDTYYTLTAFNNIGHFEELERYLHYIENITAQEEGRYQPLYSIRGEKQLTEIELDLKGYLDRNKPVRIGNDAYTHIQNDVYGQVLAALVPLYVDNRFISNRGFYSRNLVMHTLKMIMKTMKEKDAGLWEFRHKAQYHCYTFLFHWAGACAAVKIAHHMKDEEMMAMALQAKSEACEMIERCYDQEQKCYTQAAGVTNLDASCLQLITMGYLDPNSEKAKLHLRALEKGLKTESGLFYRYIHEDDFGKPKSTFLICSYWYIEALACVGRVEEAMLEFEKISKHSNHLKLLSEDVEDTSGSQWGNFPQAYSHVGQVNAAFRIARKLDLPNFV